MSPRHRGTGPKRQRGVVLLVTLIALVIMLIGGLALIRSSDTALVIAGNLAFKRDLTNQAERAAAMAIAAFEPDGALYSTADTYASMTSANYSATILPTASNNRGIPDALLDDSLFATYGVSGNDIVDASANVTIRYLIDRMCSAAGPADATTCALSTQASDKGGTGWLRKAGGGFQPVYRVSIRVTGPRNTQAFVQTTLAN